MQSFLIDRKSDFSNGRWYTYDNKRFEKKSLKLSIILLISGVFKSLIGFGMSGWDTEKYNTNDSKPWYRTIQMN